MKQTIVTVLSGVLLSACTALCGEPPVNVQKELPSVVAFDWTVVGTTFFLEVKNCTAKPFRLDALFAWGFNIQITGLDAGFKRVYKTPFGLDLDRGTPTIIVLQPGNFHRTPFRVDHFLKTLPKSVRYISLRWTLNQYGSKLPKEGLETTIYELRKDP